MSPIFFSSFDIEISRKRVLQQDPTGANENIKRVSSNKVFLEHFSYFYRALTRYTTERMI